MSEHAEEHHGADFYVKTWGILLVLFVISVAGPMLEIKWLTLITAFGIAGIKAYLVAVRFMHITIEKKFITYIMITMLAMMLLFWAGIVVDIGAEAGLNWNRVITPR